MSAEEKNIPWMCHVCDRTGTGESVACAVCYKTTCKAHLSYRSLFNKESGLYEIQPVCVYCRAEDSLQ